MTILGILPLRDQWAAANRALMRNQPEVAYQLFEEFNHWYSGEAATQSPEFKEKLYRLWGLSSLESGSVSQGISLLETWLRDNPSQVRFRAFIRYQLASAYLVENHPDKAVQHWARFVEEHPDLPECALIKWLWADLLLSQGNYEHALPLFQELTVNSRLSETGRALATAALAIVLMHLDQPEESFHQLHSISTDTIARIWRSILSPSLTDRFLRGEKFQLAQKSSAWFATSESLQPVFQIIQSQASMQHNSVRHKIWSRHWTNQLGKATTAIDSMIQSGCALGDLYLMKITALLKAESPMHAYVLSRLLLETDHPDIISIREKAYSSVIESCIALENWDAASQTVDRFLTEFPDNPELPNILFLQARSSAARNEYALAVSQIDQLIDQFPGHKSARSWKATGANWRISAGQFMEALEILVHLEQECPDSWRNYLKFEQARCRESLNQLDEAKVLYSELASQDGYSNLSEQASIALLKIHLSESNWEAFQSEFNSFQENFSEGNNLSTAELILASFHELAGRIESAIDVYKRVSLRAPPHSEHAHLQLSRILVLMKEYSEARVHALDWISHALDNHREIPQQALLDCLVYQDGENTAALPESHVSLLMDRLSNNDTGFPCSIFLQLLNDQWAHYSGILQVNDISFHQWIDSLESEFRTDNKDRSWTVVMLFLAELLEKSGRPDSADVKRIQIVTTTDPSDLEKYGLFTCAKTAYRYDFPESESLLKLFINKHERADEIPDCLYMLSDIQYNSGHQAKAFLNMKTIVNQWQDSSVHTSASLQLAQWQYDDGMLRQAEVIIEDMLKAKGLPPGQTAQALLLRALIDRKNGRIERCRQNCERILILYPDIHDISEQTNSIIESFSDA